MLYEQAKCQPRIKENKSKFIYQQDESIKCLWRLIYQPGTSSPEILISDRELADIALNQDE